VVEKVGRIRKMRTECPRFRGVNLPRDASATRARSERSTIHESEALSYLVCTIDWRGLAGSAQNGRYD